MSGSVIDLDTQEIVEIWCRYREPIVTLVFDASDFTKPEKKEQPASKKDEATVKPAEIEVSVPERDQDTEELVPQPASKKDAGVHELLQVRRPPAVDLPVLGLQLTAGEAGVFLGTLY